MEQKGVPLLCKNNNYRLETNSKSDAVLNIPSVHVCMYSAKMPNNTVKKLAQFLSSKWESY